MYGQSNGKQEIDCYCEEFENLHPNYDYYRFMKLGEEFVI